MTDDAGPLNFEVETPQDAPAQLNVGVPSGAADPTLVVEYAFADHDDFDGWMPAQGVSFLWPYFCGNLFPCKSDPADGVTFAMAVTGVADGLTAVYPEQHPGRRAVVHAGGRGRRLHQGRARQDHRRHRRSTSGTCPDRKPTAPPAPRTCATCSTSSRRPTAPTPSAPTSGTVSADWGGGDYGGMEHHPFWHVSSGSIYSEEVNAHEAAHGWFGNGVRIDCWEDFVLSEGDGDLHGGARARRSPASTSGRTTSAA